MVCIENAPYSSEKFIVRQKDSGMGRGAKTKPISFEAALETIKHYYGKKHDRIVCGFCALKEK